MNLGSTFDAAPKAASSRASKYSFTARGASFGSMALRSQSSFGVEFCLFASASIKLASAARRCPLTKPSAMHRATVFSNRCRRTNDTRGSNGLLRTADVRTGCQSNSLPTACGSTTQDRWRDDPCGCKTRIDTGGYRLNQRTDLSSAEGDLAEHDLPTKTHKTAPPVLPASPLSLAPSTPIRRSQQAHLRGFRSVFRRQKDMREADICKERKDSVPQRQSSVNSTCLSTKVILVGLRGFEPPTPCSRSRCATRLRYSPTVTGGI